MKKMIGVILLIVIVISTGVALCGCLGGSPKGSAVPGPTVQPATEVTSVDPSAAPVLSEYTATTIRSPDLPEPAVTRTDNGYILKDVPGSGDTVEVQLKAGKANFHIILPEYAVGDSYTLTLTNVEGPFTYRSSHEFSGNSGAGDIRIVKTIPRDGTYEISLGYDDRWEIEVTQ